MQLMHDPMRIAYCDASNTTHASPAERHVRAQRAVCERLGRGVERARRLVEERDAAAARAACEQHARDREPLLLTEREPLAPVIAPV